MARDIASVAEKDSQQWSDPGPQAPTPQLEPPTAMAEHLAADPPKPDHATFDSSKTLTIVSEIALENEPAPKALEPLRPNATVETQDPGTFTPAAGQAPEAAAAARTPGEKAPEDCEPDPERATVETQTPEPKRAASSANEHGEAVTPPPFGGHPLPEPHGRHPTDLSEPADLPVDIPSDASIPHDVVATAPLPPAQEPPPRPAITLIPDASVASAEPTAFPIDATSTAEVPPANAEPGATTVVPALAPEQSQHTDNKKEKSHTAPAARVKQPTAPETRWQRTIPILRKTARYALIGAASYLALVLALIPAYRVVNPPFSTLMAIRFLSGTSIDRTWTPLSQISPNLVRAVVVAEDDRFCTHAGVDVAAMSDAIENGGRGASTLSMQVTKNLFLWPTRSYIRKVIEIPLTLITELVWPKWRILELYLNVAEWGPGIFGAEAAARHHFNKSAARLSPSEAALLAASLPNPFIRDAGDPGPRTAGKARVIQSRVRAYGDVASCVTGLYAAAAPEPARAFKTIRKRPTPPRRKREQEGIPTFETQVFP